MSRKRLLVAAIATTAVLSGVEAQAAGQPLLVRQSLEEGAPYVTGELLVQYRGGVTEDEKATANRAIAGASDRPVIREPGEYEVDVVKFGALIPIQAAIDELSKNPAVDFVEPNWIYTQDQVSNDPVFLDGRLWGVYGDASSPANRFGSGAAELWANGHVGSRDVYVGVIDEGIMFGHDDLRGNIFNNPYDPVDGRDNDKNGYVDDVRGWDFFNKDRSIFDGTQDDHGTHVAGTIGARGGNAEGVVGVNWQVTLISAKFLGPKGGSNADAIKAINYLTRLKKMHKLNIVATNNSWGGAGYSEHLLKAINRAGEEGILFVAAAGNDAVNTDRKPHYPASYKSPYIISVASIDADGQLSDFSNFGAESVDIAAPGSYIYSTVPRKRDGYFVSGYASYSGTSMATPHVTGMIALQAAKHPNWTAGQLKRFIITKATPTASLRNKTRTGGRLSNGVE